MFNTCNELIRIWKSSIQNRATGINNNKVNADNDTRNGKINSNKSIGSGTTEAQVICKYLVSIQIKVGFKIGMFFNFNYETILLFCEQILDKAIALPSEFLIGISIIGK